MPATLGVTSDYGIAAPEGGVIEEQDRERSLEIKTLRDETGTTVRAVPSKVITTNVTIKGKGTAPLSLVTAGDIAEGVLKIKSVKNTEANADFPSYEIAGVTYESA